MPLPTDIHVQIVSYILSWQIHIRCPLCLHIYTGAYVQVHIYRYVYTGANCQVHCAVADVSIDDMFVEDEAGDRNSGR